MCVYLRLTITDTLRALIDCGQPVNPLAKVTRTFWYRLPADWIVDGRLAARRREHLLDLLYGPGWRTDDGGSGCVILDLREQVLTDEETRGRRWRRECAAFYAWCEGDRLEEVSADRM